jgi:uncharacterized protein (UPF0276 family)
VGLGLRWEFLDALVDRTVAADASGAARPPIDFLEVSPENYLRRGGRYPEALAWLAERYPVVTHGLSMSLGGTDPLDDAYLRDVRATVHALRSPWHSDHLCFGAFGGRALHELLPVPFKRATAARIGERIRRARDVLGVPLAIENISYYWHPGRAEMTEPEFLSEVCAAADCGLLLDVNNAYVNATNFGLDLDAWFRAAPLDRVVEIHVAGHEWFSADATGIGAARPARAEDAIIVDTHGADVPSPVFEALERVLRATGPKPVLLERDQAIPPLDGLLDEITRVRAACLRAQVA